MKTLLLSLFLFVSVGVIYAQPEVLWTTALGGQEGEQGLGIIQADDGSIVAIGNEASFDGGGTDGWIVILDQDGEETWSANFGGNGYDRFYGVLQIEEDFVLAGYTASIGAGQFDFWLTKIDDEGRQLWNRSFGGREHERCIDFMQTDGGGFALAGHTYSFGAGQADGWLVVTDEDGVEDWSETFGGNGDDHFSSIADAGDGNFVAAGKTTSIGAGGYDFWLVKIAGNGDEIWSEAYGGEDDDQGSSVISTDDGGYALVGSTVSFGENSADIWLIKVDENGEETWSRTFDNGGNESCRSVIQTFDGGYLLLGQTEDYLDERCDYWVVRTDDEGEELWSETYGGNRADIGTDVVQLEDGSYVLNGWTSSVGAGGTDMWIVKLGPEPAGVVIGFVLNLEDDEPLEGADVTTTNGLRAETNDEGFFSIDPAWGGDFDITASLACYNDLTLEDRHLERGDTLEVVFRLTHPEFLPSIDSIETELGVDESTEYDFTVRNSGNGPLEWSVDRRLRGEANIDPWEMRLSFNFGVEVDDDRLEGVVFTGDLYYVAGANDGEPLIHIFNRDGEPVNSFSQPQLDDRGFRDMAFDGELIWGCIGDSVFGIDLDGVVNVRFQSPINPTKVITWDTIRECLWIAGPLTDPVAYTRAGEPFEDLEVDSEGLRVSGLAFYEDDPDDSPLYMLHRERETNRPTIHKINIETEELTFVSYLDPEEGGSPGGAFITDQIDVYSWVFVNVVSNPDDDGGDRIDVWQVHTNTSWMQIEPSEGTVDPGDEQNFTLTLNSTNLRPVEYPGVLAFNHNASEDEFLLPVTLSVVEGPHQATQRLRLQFGWNLISAYLQPEEDDITVLTRDLVDDGLLLLMKDDAGHFYLPETDFNNIPDWEAAEGYMVKMAHAGELALEGMTKSFDEPIELTHGWQMVSYYPRASVDTRVALSGLGDDLTMAKDGLGNFYIPEYNFSNMGLMRSGKGYMLLMSEDSRLVYRLQEEDEIAASSGKTGQSVYSQAGQLTVHQPTGANMSLLVMANSHLSGEIGVYACGNLVGSGVLDRGTCGIALWGDDPSTPEIDGAVQGQSLDLVLLNDNGGATRAVYQTIAGDSIYLIDSFWAVKLKETSVMPVEFAIVSVYPNPFNAGMTIQYALPSAGNVSMTLTDISGRRVTTMFTGHRKPGVYTANIKEPALPSGLYFVRLVVLDNIATKKVVLIR